MALGKRKLLAAGLLVVAGLMSQAGGQVPSPGRPPATPDTKTSPAPAITYLYVGKPGTLADVAGVLNAKAAEGWEYTGTLDINPAELPKGKEFEGITKDTNVVLVFKKLPTSDSDGELRFYKLQKATAERTARNLAILVGGTPGVIIRAEPTTNAVLVFGPNSVQLAVAELLKDLDRPAKGQSKGSGK